MKGHMPGYLAGTSETLKRLSLSYAYAFSVQLMDAKLYRF